MKVTEDWFGPWIEIFDGRPDWLMDDDLVDAKWDHAPMSYFDYYDTAIEAKYIVYWNTVTKIRLNKDYEIYKPKVDIPTWAIDKAYATIANCRVVSPLDEIKKNPDYPISLAIFKLAEYIAKYEEKPDPVKTMLNKLYSKYEDHVSRETIESIFMQGIELGKTL
jgi:hypothetical protein